MTVLNATELYTQNVLKLYNLCYAYFTTVRNIFGVIEKKNHFECQAEHEKLRRRKEAGKEVETTSAAELLCISLFLLLPPSSL